MNKLAQTLMILGLAAVLALAINVMPGAAQVLEQVNQAIVDGVFGPGSTAETQSASEAVPPVIGQGVVSLGAEAFQPYNPAAPIARDALMLYATGTATSYSFDAPITLPDGAQMNQVVMYYEDNDPSRDMSVYFVRTANTSSSGAAMASVSSSDAAAGIRNAVITNFGTNPLIIDNGSNSYFIRVTLYSGGAHKLKSVRVEYSYQTNLPVVIK